MMNHESMEDLSYRGRRPSNFIPAGSWHRVNRLATIQRVIDACTIWAVHEALGELSNEIGYVIITPEKLGESLGISSRIVKRDIAELAAMRMWIKHYDKRNKWLELQANPTVGQKYNDATVEFAAILSWRRLATLSGQPENSFEFSLEKADGCATLRSELGALRGKVPLPLGKEDEMVLAYVAEIMKKNQESIDELKSTVGEILAELRKHDPNKAEQIHLTVIKGGKD